MIRCHHFGQHVVCPETSSSRPTMNFPDSFFFFSLFFFFPGARLRELNSSWSPTRVPTITRCFLFFCIWRSDPASQYVTGEHRCAPPWTTHCSPHPLRSSRIVGSEVMFFSVTRATDSLCTGRSFRGQRIRPPSFCTRKGSAFRTNPKAKAKGEVLPVSVEHDERWFMFPPARSGG